MISYLKLRELLRERGISHKELYEKAHVGNNALARIQKDGYMDMESLEKIARYLNVEFGDIVSRKK